MSVVLFSACLVIGIADGDTVRVRCDEREKAFQVRIAEIDAPETAHKGLGIDLQPFGRESRESLSALCQGKPATVRRYGFDRHRRAIGAVACAGVDVARHQVQSGMAWTDPGYGRKGSTLPESERAARALGLGLWSDANPVPPWIWRRPGPKCEC